MDEKTVEVWVLAVTVDQLTVMTLEWDKMCYVQPADTVIVSQACSCEKSYILDVFQVFCDGETVLGHMEKVDEVPIVMTGTLFLFTTFIFLGSSLKRNSFKYRHSNQHSHHCTIQSLTNTDQSATKYAIATTDDHFVLMSHSLTVKHLYLYKKEMSV